MHEKIVVVVGSTGGLGTLLAKSLYMKGVTLALVDIDLPKLKEQSAQLPNSTYHHADVRESKTLEEAFKAIATKHGKIDICLAVAGIEVWDPTLELSEERWTRCIDINLNGVWRTFRAALPYVKETKGYLGCVSSIAAFVHAPFFGAYSASKAGVLAMCDSVRQEVKPFGVDVGTFHPIFFDSGLLSGVESRQSWQTIWNGHKYPFQKADVQKVADTIVACIERRGRWTVAPFSSWVVAYCGPVISLLCERFFWNVPKAYEASDLVRNV